MATNYIIDINDENFEFEVVQFSLNTPVVIDFWADWCKQCKELTPILERLAHEASGSFRLARVNVDHSPNLALRFGVRTVPTVKVFTQAEVVGEMVGMQNEGRLREFLRRITPPSPFNLAIEKAQGLFSMKQWDEAEKLYVALLEQMPDHPACLLGLAKIAIIRGEAPIALRILQKFPASRLYNEAQTLIPLAESLTKHARGMIQTESNFDTMFLNSLNLVVRGNFAAALDGLLGILRENKTYRHDLARTVYLGILEMMDADDPEARQYRAELASALF